VVWIDDNTFNHWDHLDGGWMGTWDAATGKYSSINWTNVNNSVQVATDLLNKWGNHPAVVAFEPVNEPWGNSDIPTLKI